MILTLIQNKNHDRWHFERRCLLVFSCYFAKTNPCLGAVAHVSV